MGPRFPAGIPSVEQTASDVSGTADCGVYRQRDATGAARYRGTTAVEGSAEVGLQFPTRESKIFYQGVQGPNAGRVPARSSAARQGRKRNCVLPDGSAGGRD